MLVPESQLPPSQPLAPSEDLPFTELESSKTAIQGKAEALEPLRLPPRPQLPDERASAPAADNSRTNATEGPSSAGDTTNTPREPTLQPRLFLTNLTESISIMVDGAQRFARDENVSTAYKALTFGGATAVVVASSAYGVAWGLGATCFVLARLGGSLTENKHTRAHGAVLGSVLSFHFMSLGLDAMASSSEVFAGRMLLQSMIPESKKVANALVATAGIALSSYLFCASPGFTSEVSLQNAPLAVTIVAGVASSLSDKWSWASRIAHLACSAFMLPYHCIVSGSLFLAALSGVFAYGNIRNIVAIDLPRVRGKRETLS